MTPLATKPLREVLDAVGEVLGPSDWLTVDSEHLSLFARATYMGVDDPVDHTISGANRLGPDLLDGFLSLSLIIHFNWNLFPFRDPGTWALNYGLNRVRFPEPIYVGDRVRGRFEITRAQERGEGVLVESHAEVEVEGRGKPGVVADWLCLYLSEDAEIAA